MIGRENRMLRKWRCIKKDRGRSWNKRSQWRKIGKLGKNSKQTKMKRNTDWEKGRKIM